VRLVYIAGLAFDPGYDMMVGGGGNGTPTPFTVEDVSMLLCFRSWQDLERAIFCHKSEVQKSFGQSVVRILLRLMFCDDNKHDNRPFC